MIKSCTVCGGLYDDGNHPQTAFAGAPCNCVRPDVPCQNCERLTGRVAELEAENEQWRTKLADALGRETRKRLRAERAESDLAALRGKIAEARVISAESAASMLHVDMHPSIAGHQIALLNITAIRPLLWKEGE